MRSRGGDDSVMTMVFQQQRFPPPSSTLSTPSTVPSPSRSLPVAGNTRALKPVRDSTTRPAASVTRTVHASSSAPASVDLRSSTVAPFGHAARVAVPAASV